MTVVLASTLFKAFLKCEIILKSNLQQQFRHKYKTYIHANVRHISEELVPFILPLLRKHVTLGPGIIDPST